MQQAGQTALDDIATERENSLTALEDEGDKQQSAVAGAGASALEAIHQAGQTVTGQITQTGATQVGAVQSAGTTQVGLVNSAGQQQAENIAQAGSQQVQAVQTAGTAAAGTVNDARDEAVEEIETANAHAPQINSTTGYWQTWDTETGQYVDTTTKAQGATPQLTIGTVTTLEPDEDATVAITGPAEAPVLNFGIPKGEPSEGSTGGSDLPATTAADRGKAPTVNAAGTGYELTGPYAPLSAAIIETVKGNPAVCEDSVEWGLQGIRVYGKSTQITTTGAQLFDKGIISSPTSIGVIDYYPIHVGDGNFILSSNIPVVANITNLFLLAGSVNSGANSTSNGVYLNKPITVTAIDGFVTVGYRTRSSNNTNDPMDYDIMLNAGSTPLPFEPYTGGKPSPSPEYPQEIHSAGDEGSVSITLSDSGEQSQTLTFDTPDGLPGIPVDSGGNFVDVDGQEWICNYRDYDAEKDNKTIEYIANYNNEFVGDIWMSTTGQLTVGASVLYVLDTPIETPIPDTDLAAYRALHAYDGTTVITPDDALAEVEVDYIVKPKAYIKKKLTAIEQKIQEVAAAQIDTQTGG